MRQIHVSWGGCGAADGGRAESKTTKLGVLVEMLNSVGWEGELNHAQKTRSDRQAK